MALPPLFDRLRLPAIGAPMFIVSGPDLVIEQCFGQKAFRLKNKSSGIVFACASYYCFEISVKAKRFF